MRIIIEPSGKSPIYAKKADLLIFAKNLAYKNKYFNYD